jgi:integrase
MPVYKDEKTNTWYCKFYYTDYTGTKKQKLKRGFALQRDAKDWERNFLEKMEGSPSMTIQTLHDLYLEDMKDRVKGSTYYNKKKIFKNHILPYFKDVPVNEITASDVRKWQQALFGKELSPYYLKMIHGAFSTLFNYAIKYYHLHSNPCNLAGSIGKYTSSLNFWTYDEYKKIISHISDIRYYTALQVLFYSGMRVNEMLALTYGDIDFKNNTISVNKTIVRTEEGIKLDTPKTEKSNRIITMPTTIMEELSSYCKKIYGVTKNDKLFPFSTYPLRHNMEKAAAIVGVHSIRIHDLRHSHVSLLIDLEFTPYLIAERIGDNPDMILKVYGHLYPNRHKDVAEKIDLLLVSK